MATTETAPGTKDTLKIENTEKRDVLIEQEKRYQQIWNDTGIFNADAPNTTEVPVGEMSPDELRAKYPKFFGTMAYPYMNGTLHVGHSFTVSKIEFSAGYARMQGKRVLYPQGYHCTGMPIKACADKLVREIELFGQNFERCDSETTAADTPAPVQQTTKEDVTKFSGKKSKATAKTAQMKYQFQIMLAIGIPLEDIHKFADPQHWLRFFPPLCRRDLRSLGCRIDWRRSFITTDANPYYDAFVRWQMNRLKELGKIRFGKRYTIYSPKDGQACMDHDRSEGEGVGAQQYTALKLKVTQWSDKAKAKIDSSSKLPANASVYFIPATLRPETMYGQTCCFVGPTITYGIFQVSPEEFYFISERAARNMAFQGIFPQWGEYPKIVDLLGSEVIGTCVDAPLSVHKNIRILPMESVKASKGTGVVSCVPSDSPDDFATSRELQKKAAYYGIQEDWIPQEILPVIKTPSYGDLTAKFLVESMKIQSPKDTKALAEAKDLAYKEGYYKGVMVAGEFAGEAVVTAKIKIRNQLVDMGEAFEYAEPDGFVKSRSGDECVTAHLDQWYLAYGKTESGGDSEWQQTVLDYVGNQLNTFSTEAKNAFEKALDWLSVWPCARSYGLGSKLPWAPEFLVESLSDSTIYMSYYTISHLLHTDIFGQKKGPANIDAEQMTDEVWDYVFGRTNDIQCGIPQATLDGMRREFEYWYPLDLRVSGKDLVQNHLLFFLYVHLAIFPKEFWPQGVRVNGHLLLNGDKMSKSTGNFLTLEDAVKKFGADATRVALADAGDGMDDANFDETVANSTILRFYELRKWCEELINDAHLLDLPAGETYADLRNKRVKVPDCILRPSNAPKTFWDNLFEDELSGLVRKTESAYDAANYKAALKFGFYDFTNARDSYREATKAAGIGMHDALVRHYIKLQALLLAPLAPHWAEYVYSDVLHSPTSIQLASFPQVPPQDASLTAARDYVRGTTSNITSAEGAQQKKLAKGKTTSFDPKSDKKLIIYMTTSYPRWQDHAIALVSAALDSLAIGAQLNTKEFATKFSKQDSKKGMPFVTGLKRRLDAGEDRGAVLQRKIPFDERDTLQEMIPALKQALLKCQRIEVVSVEGDEGAKTGKIVGGSEGVELGTEVTNIPGVADVAMPGAPTFFFENV